MCNLAAKAAKLIIISAYSALIIIIFIKVEKYIRESEALSNIFLSLINIV